MKEVEAYIFLGIFAVVIILVLVIAVSSCREGRRKRGQRLHELEKLAFKALENPPTEAAEILCSLHRNEHTGDLRPREVYERKEAAYTLYLYDMLDYSHDVTAIVTGGVAVHSEKLAIPAFTVIHKIGGPGGFSHLMKYAMDKVIGMTRTPLDFGQFPLFHEKYYVVGDDESAIRSFLTGPLLSLLCEKTWRTIEARGNSFAYDRRDSYDYAKKSKVEVGTKEKIQEALELFRAFTERDEPGDIEAQ